MTEWNSHLLYWMVGDRSPHQFIGCINENMFICKDAEGKKKATIFHHEDDEFSLDQLLELYSRTIDGYLFVAVVVTIQS